MGIIESELNNFFYLIFQAYPSKEKIYYWIDGSRFRKVLTKEKFLRAVDKNDSLKHDLYEAICTTSFYLYDNVDNKILRLNPKTELQTFTAPLQNLYKRANGVEESLYQRRRVDETTLDDKLNELGFGPIDDSQIKNLQVTLRKVKK